MNYNFEKFVENRKEEFLIGEKCYRIVLAKVGYGTASLADALSYDFVYIFFLFFLTDITGVSVGFAGTISFVAILWDAITDPLIGYLSDNSKCKYGRRRPYMIAAVIPLAVTLTLMFTKVELRGTAKNIYYLMMAIGFWLSYTVFIIPYSALGAELTTDYDERTKLRSYSAIFNYIGLLLGSALPLLLIGFFNRIGQSEEAAWQYTALVLGIICAISITITWISTRGKEISVELKGEESETREGFFKTFIQVLKLKPYKYIIFAVMFFMTSYSMFEGNLLYFMTYKLGLGEAEMSILFVFATLTSFVFIPLITAISTKIGKKNTYIGGMVLIGIVSILFRFVDINSMTMIIFFSVIYIIANTVYWTLIYSLIYDVCELDEFISGKRREGIVTSYASFFAKLGGAIGLQILGLILEFSGYNPEAEVQTQEAMNGIISSLTLIPGMFLILGGLMIVFYPITKSRYEALLQALELKRQGKDYTTEEFGQLL